MYKCILRGAKKIKFHHPIPQLGGMLFFCQTIPKTSEWRKFISRTLFNTTNRIYITVRHNSTQHDNTIQRHTAQCLIEARS